MVFKFAHPLWLLALLIIPAMIWFRSRWQERKTLRIPFTRVSELRHVVGKNSLWKYVLPGLRYFILFCLILAVAQPRWGKGTRDLSSKGVDVVLAVDISGSMLAMDFAPQNRLRAAVNVAKDFIIRRPNDRFGLVAFSEYALTQSPLTFDHEAILEQLDRLEVNQDASFTAIGLGLAKAVARLKDSTAKSKIVILITDGVSNTGEIDPLSAARIAKNFGIRVYPIGVGSNGYVDYPINDPRFGTYYQKVLVELDMDTLNKVAEITGTGEASHAGDREQLKNIMSNINKLEKTEYKAKINYIWSEKFPLLLWLAFLGIVIELCLRLLFILILPE